MLHIVLTCCVLATFRGNGRLRYKTRVKFEYEFSLNCTRNSSIKQKNDDIPESGSGGSGSSTHNWSEKHFRIQYTKRANVNGS